MTTWDWQDLATWMIVAAALIFLTRRFVPGFSRKRAAGCSHCPVKNAGAGSCCETPVVITLNGLQPRGPGSSGTPTDRGHR